MGNTRIYKNGSLNAPWHEHKLKSVKILEGYTIELEFQEGVIKHFDVSTVFGSHKMYDALEKNYNLFKRVHLSGNSGIAWNDDIDIGAEKLWADGVTVKTLFDELIGMSDATKEWGLNESTLRQAIRYGRFVKGEDVYKFGGQWVLVKAAVEREYGLCINDEIEWLTKQLAELDSEDKRMVKNRINELKNKR